MATVSDIRFNVLCPVCVKVYESPKILRCLHTICATCTDTLTKLSCVRCPQCDIVTKTTDIINDFKMQTWIDLYFKMKDSKSMKQSQSNTQDTRLFQHDIVNEPVFNLQLSTTTGNQISTVIPSAPPECDLSLSLHEYETSLYSITDRQINLQAFQKHRYDLQKPVTSFLNDTGLRINAIDDCIWVVLDSGRICKITEESGKFKQDFIEIQQECDSLVGYVTGAKNNVTFTPKAVTQMRNNDIIVASDGAKGLYNSWVYKDYGLLHINSNGNVQCVVARGRYADVTNNYDFIYSLRADPPQSMVEVHYYNSHTIQCVTVLHFHIMAPSMRILALPDCLFMTSAAGDSDKTALCKQNMTMGSADVSPPFFIKTSSDLQHLHLACVDSGGTLLLTDTRTDRLVLKDFIDRFHQLEVGPLSTMTRPVDAAIKDLDQLFVLATCSSTRQSCVYQCV